jgi:UDP-3-O-[3-hydroxymyristoyl] glucosamine N-acyltransferase
MNKPQQWLLCVSEQFKRKAQQCALDAGASIAGYVRLNSTAPTDGRIDFDRNAIFDYWHTLNTKEDAPLIFVLVGKADQAELPKPLVEIFSEWNFRCVTFVNNKASYNAGASLAEGCVVMENTSLQPCCAIGRGTVVMSNCYIGHHSHIGENVFIDQGVSVCGQVEIGSNTSIGKGAVIRDGMSVGPNCQIGAGAVITKRIGAGGIYGPGLNNLLS